MSSYNRLDVEELQSILNQQVDDMNSIRRATSDKRIKAAVVSAAASMSVAMVCVQMLDELRRIADDIEKIGCNPNKENKSKCT
jgi:hypothetical protein